MTEPGTPLKPIPVPDNSFDVLARLSPHWVDMDPKFHWPPRTDYYEHYALWSSLVKPCTFLEIGIMYGWSAMAVLAGWEHIDTMILIDSELYEIPVAEAKRRVLDFCEVECIDKPDIHTLKVDTKTLTELPQWISEDVDLIHIDGEHSEAAVYNDLKICSEVLANGGTIIVDDLSLPGIKAGADRFLRERPDFTYRVARTHQMHYLIWKR